MLFRIVMLWKREYGKCLETLGLEMKTHRQQKEKQEQWKSSGDVDVEKSLKYGV